MLIRAARPSTTAVLPTPGLAEQHRVVLGAAGEDLHDPLDLGLATDHRVELALLGEAGQVAAELVEQFRRLFALALTAAADAAALATAAGTGEHADDLVADLVRVGVEVEQDAGGDALVLTHEAEQDVLGADVVVAERERLAQGQLEHLLGARGERDLAGGDLLAGADDADHLRAHPFDGDVEGLEDAGGETLLLAEQAEQDVLGADVVVLERPRLLLGEDDDLAGSLGESLEQKIPLLGRTRLARVSTGRRPSLSAGIHVFRNSTESVGPATESEYALTARFRRADGTDSVRNGRRPQDFIAGNSSTSRMLAAPVSIITSRSIAEADAAGRRHALFERLDEDLVVGLGLLVAAGELVRLLLEAAPLLVGVVQLAEGVGDLHARRRRPPSARPDPARCGVPWRTGRARPGSRG